MPLPFPLDGGRRSTRGWVVRAINIAIAVMMLSASFSIVASISGAANPVGYNIDMGSVEQEVTGLMANNGTISAIADFVQGMKVSVSLLFTILKGTLLLGNTVSVFIPSWIELPKAFIDALNAISLVSVSLALIQFIRGIGTRGTD